MAYDTAERAERLLPRPVQVTIRTVEQWEHPESDPFLLEVQRRPLVEIDRDAEMTVTWQTGEAEIDGMIAQGEVERTVPSDELAARSSRRRTGLASAEAIKATDPTGSYQLACDAARKACVALLAVQGLRATNPGGHIAVQDAMCAQFRGVFALFRTLRRVRKQCEYPDITTPTTTVDDAVFAIDAAADIE